MGKKINDLYQKRERMSGISKKGREFVEFNYDADKNILKYYEEFQKLIE